MGGVRALLPHFHEEEEPNSSEEENIRFLSVVRHIFTPLTSHALDLTGTSNSEAALLKPTGELLHTPRESTWARRRVGTTREHFPDSEPAVHEGFSRILEAPRTPLTPRHAGRLSEWPFHICLR